MNIKSKIVNIVIFSIGIVLSLFALFLVFFSIKYASPLWLYRIPRMFSDGETMKLCDFIGNIHNFYFALVVGLPGIYFTVLGLFLNSRDGLSIKAVFSYTTSKIEFLLFGIALINLIAIIFISILNPSYKCFFYYEVFCIFELIAFFIVAFDRMFCVENPTKCARLMYKKCVLKNKINASAMGSFYTDFLKPAFKDNAVSVFEKCKKINGTLYPLTKSFDCDVLEFLSDRSQSSVALYFCRDDDLLDECMRMTASYVTQITFQIQLRKNVPMEDFDLLARYRDLYFRFYINLFHNNKITYPKILEISIDIRFTLQTREKGFVSSPEYKKLCEIYKKILVSSKNVVVFSLHHCDTVDIHSHLKDFSCLIQMLDIYKYSDEIKLIVELHEKLFVDIITHIINLVQMQRLDKNMLIFVYRSLPLINQIEIFGANTEMYFEIMPRTDFHTVIYSRNYYLLLLLVLCKAKNTNLYEETLKKMNYGDSTLEDKLQLYQLLKSQCRNVTDDDLHLLSDGESRAIGGAFKFVDLDLDERIEDLKKEQVDNLERQDFTEEIKLKAEKVIDRLKENFALMFDETKNDNANFHIPIACDFSARAMINERNNVNVELTYGFSERLIYEIFYNSYISDSATSKQIETISEIPNIEDEKIIFASRDYFDYFFNDKLIQFNGISFSINGKKKYVYFFYSDKSGIVLQSDLAKRYTITDIYSLDKRMTKKREEKDIIFTVPFNIILASNEDVEFVVYKF